MDNFVLVKLEAIEFESDADFIDKINFDWITRYIINKFFWVEIVNRFNKVCDVDVENVLIGEFEYWFYYLSNAHDKVTKLFDKLKTLKYTVCERSNDEPTYFYEQDL